LILSKIMSQQRKPIITKEKDSNNCLSQTGTSNSLSIVTDDIFSLLGRSTTVGDYNNDQLDDVAIGAPGFGGNGVPQGGAVYIVYGRKKVSGHENIIVGQGHSQNATTLFGTLERGRLGWSLGTVDFNMDGYDDLIASMPGTNSELLKYTGEIFVYFGTQKGLPNQPDIIINSTDLYTNLAGSIQSGDINGDGKNDLILGIPFGRKKKEIQCGEVWIFFSSKHRKSGQILVKEDANIHISGEYAYDWFGYHTQVVNSEGNSYLIVGAPGYGDNSSITFGKVYGFDLSLVGKYQTELPLKWSISGVDEHAQLGKAFAVGNPVGNSTYLALSLPTKTIPGAHWYDENLSQAGEVIVIQIEKLKGNYTKDTITPFSLFDSDEEFSRLGTVVGFSRVFNSDGSQTLFISEPYKDSGYTPSEGDSGAIYLWKGGSGFPKGPNQNCKSSSTVCIQSNIGKSLYGFSTDMLDFDGNGLEDLIIGGPRDKSRVNNGGSVSILLNLFDQN